MKTLPLTVIIITVLISGLGSYKSFGATPDIVVAPDGSGNFTTLQKAIDAVPSNSDRQTIIYIKRGLYNTEKLIVPADKKNITLIGESREGSIISYHIYDCSPNKCPAADAAKWSGDNISTSATLTIMAAGFRAENLTIRNTAGPAGQAQALTVRGDKAVFINCDILGYQDTLYFWKAGIRCYFSGCLIAGRTDYIYGDGIAYFDECEIRSWGGGWITAPSTPQGQKYGFVFNKCRVTYATGSPRAGDDGSTVRMGRPWQNYPKVSWLYCDICGQLNPQGWGDTWNMTYAATSTDLQLYEYKNTGAGADMTGRAKWAGLRSLTDAEALNYTVQAVLGGTDNWDPTASAPLVKEYTWSGKGGTNNWLVPENWSPAGIPAQGENAIVKGKYTIQATGTFMADLFLQDTAKLEISKSATVSWLSAKGTSFMANGSDTLAGKISTKDTLVFDVAGKLFLNATLSGIHKMIKTGSGTLVLAGNNSSYSGNIAVQSGTLEAKFANCLGTGNTEIKSGARLVVGHNAAFFVNARLTVAPDAILELNSTVTTSEFYLGTNLQPPGEYTAATNPGLIIGDGKILVGRPAQFTFIGGANGNWDNPAHFSPALMPEAGETVLCEREMETTPTVFPADIILRGAGSLRLRGAHKATGTIHLENGTSFKYNTSGAGFSLDAPVAVDGDASMIMESGAATCYLELRGKLSGTAKVITQNNGKGTINTGTLKLYGDNSGFKGIWDLTRYSAKYPAVPGYISCMEGLSEYAFGAGKIVVGLKNKVIVGHVRAAWPVLNLTITDSARVVLNCAVTVSEWILNGQPVAAGVYGPSTHPALFEGNGTLTVGGGVVQPLKLAAFPGAEGHGKYVTGGRGGKVIYVTNLNDDNNPGSLRYAINQSGARIILFKVSGTIRLASGLSITKGDLTIAGQTAPGDGITLRDYPVNVDADNVIIRFMRFRMGDVTNQEADALGGRFHKNIIVDHCSMSWSVDECVSFYVNENFTLQWSLISESLRNSVHDKGAHGYGGIWGGKNASFHHNLLAHHDSRNPRLGESAGDVYALTDLVDLRNNVIYNWQGNSCYGGEAMNVNIVNCYYKPGPATIGTAKRERIISIDKSKETAAPIYNIWGKFFIDGNYMVGSTRATNDNWTYGVYSQFHSSYGTVPEAEKITMRMSVPHNPGEVTTHTAENAYEKIMLYGGASLVRDTIDKRIIKDVTSGTATYMTGGNGSINGIIDSQSAIGGWPVLSSLPAPDDSDNDGMPDNWEASHNLKKNDPSDAQLTTVDGKYPNIEVYINSLVTAITENQLKDALVSSAQEIRKQHDPLYLHFEKSTGLLKINTDRVINRIDIFTLTGMMIRQRLLNGDLPTLNVSDLKPGIYIVRVFDNKSKYLGGKFIKN